MTVLLQMWVGSPTNVWAVGLDTSLAGNGYVKHWDGTNLVGEAAQILGGGPTVVARDGLEARRVALAFAVPRAADPDTPCHAWR